MWYQGAVLERFHASWNGRREAREGRRWSLESAEQRTTECGRCYSNRGHRPLLAAFTGINLRRTPKTCRAFGGEL